MKPCNLSALLVIFILGQARAQERLESRGQIPILAWYGIPAVVK